MLKYNYCICIINVIYNLYDGDSIFLCIDMFRNGLCV